MEAGEGESPQAAEPRAFQALSFEEEKHAIIAEAHHTVAMQCRLQHLRSNDGSPDQIQETLDKCIKAGKELRQNIMGASRALWSDWESMEAVLSIAEFQRDCTIAGRILETWPGAWKLVDSSLFSDRSVMLKVIARHGWWLRYATQQLQEDREVVKAAVASDGQALEFASVALQADKQVVLTAARSKTNTDMHHPDLSCILQFASKELRSDKEVVLAAAAADPENIMYAGKALKGDRDVAFAALRSNRRSWSSPMILSVLSQQLRADRELVLEALRTNALALQAASVELKKDEDFILLAMRSVESPLAWGMVYGEADDTVTRAKSLFQFALAARSALAVQGEHAPVVSVILGNGADSQQEEAEGSATESPTFEARLLSGTSFHCSFPALGLGCKLGYDDGWERHGDDPELDIARYLYDEEGEEEDEEEEEAEEESGEGDEEEEGDGESDLADDDPPPKRPRLAGAKEQSATPAAGNVWSGRTVGDLAQLVVQELPKHMEADPLPKRVFLIISKTGGSENVSATPWDWDRQVTDLLYFL